MNEFQQIDPRYMAMLQAGLGILAANNGRQPAGAAIGQGLLGGTNAYQQNLLQQQEAALRKQQMDMQNNLFSYKQKEQDREQSQYDLTEKAIAEASAQNPELAPLFRLDPKAAIKARYPQANSVDPYFTPIATESGIGSYNNRTGKFEPLNINGSPIVKSTDSPLVRGAVKGAEAKATADYKPNTDIEGKVYTDTQVSDMARKADGVKVPTKAEQAGNVKTAEKTAEIAANQQGERTKAINVSDKLLSAAQQAKELLDLNPTGSWVGAGVDVLGRGVGMTSASSKIAAKLETLSGWMVANVPRMEGPQSNYDVENYKIMAGKVGDRKVPVEERKAALAQLVALQEKYKALNQSPVNNGSIMPKDEKMPKSVIAPIGGKKVPLKLGADGLYYDAQGNGYRKPK